MNDKKKLESIENKIKTILDARAKESEDLRQKIKKHEKDIETAEKERAAAEESMNLDAFRAAKIRREEAQDAITLYSTRLKALQRKEDVSESDSDAVIDDLLAIQNAHDIEFENDAKKIIDNVRELLAKYEATNTRIENDLRCWHENVKPNRRPGGVGSDHGEPQDVHPSGHVSWLYTKLAFYANNYKQTLLTMQTLRHC